MENQSAPLPLMCKSADGGGQDAEKSHVSVQRQVPYAARLWCTAWRPRRPHVKPTRSGLSLMKTSDYPAQTGRRKARQFPVTLETKRYGTWWGNKKLGCRWQTARRIYANSTAWLN